MLVGKKKKKVKRKQKKTNITKQKSIEEIGFVNRNQTKKTQRNRSLFF